MSEMKLERHWTSRLKAQAQFCTEPQKANCLASQFPPQETGSRSRTSVFWELGVWDRGSRLIAHARPKRSLASLHIRLPLTDHLSHHLKPPPIHCKGSDTHDHHGISSRPHGWQSRWSPFKSCRQSRRLGQEPQKPRSPPEGREERS